MSSEGQKRAQLNLGYARLEAPFDGTIVATYVEDFEEVDVGKPIVRLLDPLSIEMVVGIPENLISLAPLVSGVSASLLAESELTGMPVKRLSRKCRSNSWRSLVRLPHARGV